jgi:hypothetical protein
LATESDLCLGAHSLKYVLPPLCQYK